MLKKSSAEWTNVSKDDYYGGGIINQKNQLF